MTHQLFWISLSLLVVMWAALTRLGKVSRTKAHELVDSGGMLVDVRSQEEFDTGHLAGAFNVPLSELPQQAPMLVEKHKPIVVYCKSGLRSGAARRILHDAGSNNVHDLGAMSRW
jgi:phage shock protein E